MRSSQLSFFAFFIILSASVFAGVGSGDKIPHTLDAQDQAGVQQSFKSLVGEKGVVLVFVRSADWCPFCQQQLIELGQKGDDITALGYNIVTISYDSVDELAAFSNKYDFEYTMLSDPRSDIIQSFGILNTDYPKGTKYYGIPHPTIYVVGVDGAVQSILSEDGYKKRPPVQAILDEITPRVE